MEMKTDYIGTNTKNVDKINKLLNQSQTQKIIIYVLIVFILLLVIGLVFSFWS
jgi:hypothetical protein